MVLKVFTDPAILKQIDSRRLEKLFGHFRDDLKIANVLLPTPESENGSYFESLASTLASTTTLPERLQTTLSMLEAATAPEHQARLDGAVSRRIPNVAVSQTCALDRALELWFHAPEELSQFHPDLCNHSTPDTRPSAPCNVSVR